MRAREHRLLGRVQHPEVYDERLLAVGRYQVAVSTWRGAPGHPVVVFLPGTMTHPLFYEEFLDALSVAGFPVVGLHYPGHGKSPRTPRGWRFDDLVAAAAAAVRFAIDRFGEPVVLLGSSQGGMVALAAAGRGVPATMVIAHNVLDPAQPDAMVVTRFGAARRLHGPLVATLAAGARVAPHVPVPVGAYLDPARVFTTQETRELFEADPLALRSYPLDFMASLLTADLSGMTDGSVRCPVVVLAATGDRLFPLDYVRGVYERIVAPRKELVVLDAPCHLVFHEALPEALHAVTTRLHSLSAASQDTDA